MKIKQNTDGSGAAWLREALKIETGELGAAAADLLDLWAAGIYHLNHRQLNKTDWKNEHRISFEYRGSLATFDFARLTALMVLGHDLMLRVELAAVNFGVIQIIFHARSSRSEGDPSPIRMPYLERHVELLRSGFGFEQAPAVIQQQATKPAPMSIDQAAEILNRFQFQTKRLDAEAGKKMELLPIEWLTSDPAGELALEHGLVGVDKNTSEVLGSLTRRDAIHRARQLLRRSAKRGEK